MNILTFDIEEWFYEKVYCGGRPFKYQQYNDVFKKLLDELDKLGINGTFFCVGQLAVDFPEVVREIANRGHEVGCHSNVHTWLNKMDEAELYKDTTEAIKALQDVSGQKVVSYRAPAFSITDKNKWAVNVLADCGIENDASIFPTSRDYGGYKGFPQDTPCVIRYAGSSLKEYPICIGSVMGKRMAYSGGGYFRILPFWLTDSLFSHRDYNICYFHLNDLNTGKKKMMTKMEYENYFKEPGTLKNRLMRYVKINVNSADAFRKMTKLLTKHSFVGINEASKQIDWNQIVTINL